MLDELKIYKKVSLIEYAKVVQDMLNGTTGQLFCNIFIQAKMHCFETYHNGLVCSGSHGLNFFENIIKYWNNPETYWPKPAKDGSDLYETNFIKLIKQNKNDSNSIINK